MVKVFCSKLQIIFPFKHSQTRTGLPAPIPGGLSLDILFPLVLLLLVGRAKSKVLSLGLLLRLSTGRCPRQQHKLLGWLDHLVSSGFTLYNQFNYTVTISPLSTLKKIRFFMSALNTLRLIVILQETKFWKAFYSYPTCLPVSSLQMFSPKYSLLPSKTIFCPSLEWSLPIPA